MRRPITSPTSLVQWQSRCRRFCWGGGQSFRLATNNKDLQAAFVFYGTPPNTGADIERIGCPVYGFYAGNDGPGDGDRSEGRRR